MKPLRTTLTIDPDNATQLKRLRKERDAGLKETLNDVLRNGFAHMAAPRKKLAPFRTRVFDCGGFVDPSKSIKDMLQEMDEEYDRKKLGLVSD